MQEQSFRFALIVPFLKLKSQTFHAVESLLGHPWPQSGSNTVQELSTKSGILNLFRTMCAITNPISLMKIHGSKPDLHV